MAPIRRTLDVVGQELEAVRARLEEHDALDPNEVTEEQVEAFRADLTTAETLATELAEVQAENDRLAAVRSVEIRNVEPKITRANREPVFGSPEVIVRRDPFDGLDLTSLAWDLDAKHEPTTSRDTVARALTMLEDDANRPLGVTDAEVEEATQKIQRRPAIARWALIHGSPAYAEAFRSWLHFHGENVLYTPEQQDAVRAAMALGNSTGGFSLPTLLDPSLIHTGTASKAPFRDYSRVVNGTQNVWHGVSAGNVSAYWAAEATAMTEGSPTFAGPTVTAYKLTAYLKGSYEIFEDSALQGEMPGLIAEAFSYKEQDAFATGDGTTQPKGIVTAISASTGTTCATRGTFAYSDLATFHDSTASRYEDTSTFVANKAIYTLVRNFSTGSIGSLFWGDVRGDQPRELIDSPFFKASGMTNTTSSGSFFMVYGDFSQYLIYDRIGTAVEFVQNVFNSSALPTGERALVAHRRTGADVTDLNAFRFLKG